MKKFYLFLAALAMVATLSLSGPAVADGLDLATKNTKNFQTFSGAPATGDVEVIFDASDDKWKTLPAGNDVRTQVASTTTTATAAQCGASFISNSADVITLPEASTVLGCRYTFTCGTADDFDVNPNDGTDIIGPVSTTNGTTGVVTLSPSAGDAIRCTDIGGSITIEAIGADRWAQVGGGNGIWTDVN